MEYAKRNESLGNWNFGETDISEGKRKLDNPEVVKTAEEVVKWTLRTIELKMKKGDILGKDYYYKMGFNVSKLGGVSVHGESGSGILFQCGGCSVGAGTEGDIKGTAWAIYQLAIPEVLKKCQHIAEYRINITYNSIFGNAAIVMEFVFE